MKLWSCKATCDGYDAYKLMAGVSKEEILERWNKELAEDDEIVYGLHVNEVENVDGYKISISL